MTVKVCSYRGDGTYYLGDEARELEGLAARPPGRVLAGSRALSHPTTEGRLARLLGVPLANGRRALDVIVAAPKPVSALLAVEGPGAARRVVALHERAVDAALDYLADALARCGAVSPMALGFTHGVNRLLDPHLHTHVLLGARDPDGEVVSVGELRSHASAADALYLATLRAGLPCAAARRAWVGHGGAMRVEGVDHGLVAAISTPRGRDGRLERAGAKAHPTSMEARRHWAASLHAAGVLDAPEVPVARAGRIDEHRFAASLGEGLAGRADVVRAWAGACTFGDDAQRIRAAAALLAPGAAGGSRVPAISLRHAAGVRALGPRPMDPDGLAAWLGCRAELERTGSDLTSAARRLAIARLDAATRPHDVAVARTLRSPAELGDERRVGLALRGRRGAGPRARA